MFRCDGCKKTSRTHEKPLIAAITRDKVYPYRQYANPGRGPFGRPIDDPGGTGFETIREVRICPRCVETYEKGEQRL